MTSLVLTTLADVEPQVPPVALGLRKVPPYWYPYSTYAKERWIGREILEVVSTEFRDRSMEYYRYALESGVTTLNRKPAKPDTIVQNGDLMENVVHRHEPPVTSTPVKVLFEDKEREFIVVNKPGSIVPCTCIREILSEYSGRNSHERVWFEKVYTVNRLDRLTSGLMILPTSTERARSLTKEFMDGTIQKEYVARCKGEFPKEEIVCEEPLLTIDRQMGLNVVHPEGKTAKTVFNRIRYDPKTDSSVVLCKPMTGRSHQIRVHLQYLGHPVANDPVYSETRIWGAGLGRGGVDLTPSDERSAPAPPPHLKDSTELYGSPESLAKDGDSASTSEPKLLPRETGKDIGMGSPVPLSSEAVGVITRLRNMKDESEDWSRWRDVVFRAKEPLRPQHWALKPPPPRNKKRKGKSEFVDETLNVFRSGASPATPITPTTPDDATPVTEVPQLSVDKALKRAQGLAPVVPTPLVEAGQHYCPECYLPLHPDPKPEKLYIFLHALRYTTSLGGFETEMPEWSAPDWDWDRST